MVHVHGDLVLYPATIVSSILGVGSPSYTHQSVYASNLKHKTEKLT